MFGKKQAVRIFESGQGFRWQLFRGKEIVAVSEEGFPDSDSCTKAWFDAAQMAVEYFGDPESKVGSGRFKFRDHPMGGVDWVFRSPEGTPVATSGLPLPSLGHAERSAKRFAMGASNRFKLPMVEKPPG
jgi:hypothetical protein